MTRTAGLAAALVVLAAPADPAAAFIGPFTGVEHGLLVYGGPGADSISGGRGLDVLYGNAGNDRIGSRDRQVDRVNGGAGRDTARIDSGRDRVRQVERVR